ncbi:sialate O-acetylesterase [Pseudopedobacter beijingensis]|uniref:Sialate O-acetylesterase n=1 Tax=Pseudopedobacter beijingensis TaxID=1207056 RepID=A0ABW4I966_9SPHI
MYKLILVFLCLFVSAFVKAQEQSFLPIADVSVYEGSITTNYGAADILVKHRNGNSVTRFGYLKFNISAFNLTAAGKVTLKLYCRTKETETSPVNVNVYAVKDNDVSWTESGLNWNNKPALANQLSSVTVEESGKYYEWDVTAYIQQLINNNINEVSFVLADIADGNNTLTFNSKENTQNKPQLIIGEQPEANQYNSVYYVDADNGLDSNDGLSENTPWKSLSKVNGIKFLPGTKILFKSGGIWVGQLKPKGSGSASMPIIIDKYGTGAKPLIDGNGLEGEGVVYLYNQSYWEINNLEITNNAATEGDRRGVEINLANYGTAEHIHLKNLYIHHIKGLIGHDLAHKKTAGIFIGVSADNLVDTRYNNILIENCIIHDIQNQGIVTKSVSENIYPGEPDFERRRFTNVIIRNNILHHISKNAMIIRMTDGGLVERNLCYETAIGDGITPITGNTIFSRTVRGTVFQYNEGFLNRSPDYDGSLYDPDLISPGTIWQYSYSHDNAHGLVWFCTDPRDTGVVVRYNISQNDKGRLVYINYAFTSASVYNNVFYVGENVSPVIIEENRNNDHNYKYYNNIVYNNSSTSAYKLATSGSGVQVRDFSHNIFYGNHPAGEPADPYKITADPMFINHGSGGTGLTTLDGYKLKPGSPALGAGKIVSDNGGKDFYGNPVSSSTAPNIGVYNGEGQTSMVNPNFHLYLLIGQSNMAGRGVVAGEHTYRSHPRVLMLNAEGEWVNVKHPIHFDKSAAGVGLGMEFAIEMANDNPDVTIGLIPAAVGGTAITAWSPGATDVATGLKPYDDAVSRTHTALQKGVLKGILFHQGEANSGSTNPSTWITRVKELANNLRTEFNTPNIPFIVGELGYFRATSPNINNILPKLISEIPQSDFVSAEGLTDIGDETHFDSYSLDILGRRYAAKMQQLQNASAITTFTSGNLTVLRAGDGTRANGTGAQRLFIDEYTPGGNFLRTVALPTRETVTGTNKALVAPDLNSNYGLMTLSNDSSRLVIPGYEAGLGDSGVSTGSGERVIGFVNADGDIDTKYTIDMGSNNLRSATADDDNVWAIGTSLGVRYMDITNPATSTISGSPGSPRGIGVFNGQLYVSSSASGYYLYKVGAGLPTTTGQSATLLPGMPATAGDPYQFAFFNTEGNTEPDLLYIADNTLGLRKFWYNGSVWQDKGSAALSGLRGLIGKYSATEGTVLYGVTNTTLIKFEDSSAPAANIAVTQTVLNTALTNTTFKGIAFAPEKETSEEETTPVNLLSFTTELRNNKVRLQWSTASEQNNARFDILRSSNGKSFSRINSVEGYGNSTKTQYYVYTDESSVPGINYYKLNQVDFDGKMKEYGPVTVNTVQFSPEFKIYRADDKIYVQAYSSDENQGVLVITDIAGRELFRRNVGLISGYNSFSVDFNAIPKGIYLARLQTQAKTLTAKFVN